MGEKGVGKLSRETPPPREGEPMGAIVEKVDEYKHLGTAQCAGMEACVFEVSML